MRRPGLFLILALLAAPAAADERILDFHADITVREDASLLVTERIRVRAEGREIKRGIHRDFPTRYKDRLGNDVRVGFKVLRVARDGAPEPFHLRPRGNGESVYIGRSSVFLPPGEYAYEIVYETDRQLGFFPNYDELYWNVTGNGWAFPIDRAAATVRLPRGASVVDQEAYTGPQGARGKAFRAWVSGDGSAAFETAAPLGPKEGLTVVVSWPKGHVREPDFRRRLEWFLEDNQGVQWGLLALGVVLAYYLLVWRLVGKDPEPDSIMPLYEPPGGVSPAAARYISNMGYDDKAFAAALVNMAVRGYVTLEDAEGSYTVRKSPQGSRSSLYSEEREAADHLLQSGPSIELEQRNHASIGKAVSALKKSLSRQYEKVYFVTNLGYFVVGLLLTAALLVHNGFSSARQPEIFAFMCVWLTGWSLGVFALVRTMLLQWREFLTGGSALSLFPALFLTAFSVPFLGGEALGIFMLGKASYPMMPALLLAMVVVNYLFYDWLKAPTLAGRRVLDRIEGFKMFLSAVEKDRVDTLYPGGRTPELFERYLPYALALGVEQQWADKFTDVLARAGTAPGGNGGYHPRWYSGSRFQPGRVGGFASALGGSMAGAIASSSTAPGSGSGGGGGGSSGGGGGGGGGGGW